MSVIQLLLTLLVSTGINICDAKLRTSSVNNPLTIYLPNTGQQHLAYLTTDKHGSLNITYDADVQWMDPSSKHLKSDKDTQTLSNLSLRTSEWNYINVTEQEIYVLGREIKLRRLEVDTINNRRITLRTTSETFWECYPSELCNPPKFPTTTVKYRPTTPTINIPSPLSIKPVEDRKTTPKTDIPRHHSTKLVGDRKTTPNTDIPSQSSNNQPDKTHVISLAVTCGFLTLLVIMLSIYIITMKRNQCKAPSEEENHDDMDKDQSFRQLSQQVSRHDSENSLYGAAINTN